MCLISNSLVILLNLQAQKKNKRFIILKKCCNFLQKSFKCFWLIFAFIFFPMFCRNFFAVA